MRTSSIFGVALISFAVQGIADSGCKCLPSEPCWPSQSEWTALNESISGHLIQSSPPAAVCYPSQPNYNASECDSILTAWTSSAFHAANPVSIDASIWANNSCNPIYPNGTSIGGNTRAGADGCSIGAYPAYVINVTEPSHVQAAFNFSRKHNVRLNIKNTGHNGAGRSTAFGSLSYGIVLNDSFRITADNTAGIVAQKAVTIGAGVQDGELFNTLSAQKAFAVGGTNANVGVVGWATGGGHGVMTGAYGQGADNIIEATLVTPTGEILTANEKQNTDLFWAIRGGGGGTFGVILNMTLKAYPEPSLTTLALSITGKNATSTEVWWDVIAGYLGVVPQAQDKGVHGYFTVSMSPKTLSGSLFAWNADNATVQTAISPLKQFLSEAASNGTIDYTLAPIPITSFPILLKLLPSVENVGRQSSITASRLISREASLKRDLFAKTLQEVGPTGLTQLNGSVPDRTMSGTLTISSEPIDNALNPVWRNTTLHLNVVQPWDDSITETDVKNLIDNMTYNSLDALRRFDPASGAYLNEANAYEPGWQLSFFGQNYDRLREIKNKYDPTGLLYCRQCVGSEDWIEASSGGLCKAFMPL
ncbi:hypothetical protein BHYA_0496g00020 [Botrytis hyacinthi]|uniref:FAD-binding PCMH-type domain-containing protein n=1 Tax=Botrytis hyacinthi TaxID=278943 RepID=A0A4Z1G3R1_9HELO|nr:hypothetical protein BHYA_0496g00020 [Botrytis hyacinthi]